MAEMCSFCNGLILATKPVQAHYKSFCNYICLVGFETEKEEKTNDEKEETPLHC